MASRFQRVLIWYLSCETAFFACLAISMLRLTAGHDDCQTTASISNFILIGHVHKLLSLKKPLTCIFACQEEPNCYSINYNIGERTCELNLQTRSNHPQDFVRRSEWLYMELTRQPPKIPPRNFCYHVTCKNGGTCLNRKSGYVCVCRKEFWGRVCEHCRSLALGLENGSIPDFSINASADTHKFEAKNARLNNPTSCWKFRPQPTHTGDVSLTIAFQKKTMVTKIAIQGDPTEASWVARFSLKYFDGELSKTYTKDGKLKIFSGSSDSNTTVSQWIDPPILTRLLTIKPASCNDACAMRLELYGCRS